MRYEAVLLDIDGTLVDSNAAHAAAWSDAFAMCGRHYAPEAIRPLIGKGGDKLLREVASLDDESDEGRAIAKPDPDIVVAALKRSRVSPERAVMIGDTPYDVEPAIRAGVDAIAFRCGGWSDANLRDSIPVYDDPQDLLDRLADSPLRSATS